MTHGADVRYASHRIPAKLPLHGQIPALGIWRQVFVPEARGAGDWQKLRPVDGIVGVRWRSVGLREVRRETLPLVESRLPVNERRRKQWRRGRRPEKSVGRIALRIKPGGILVRR